MIIRCSGICVGGFACHSHVASLPLTSSRDKPRKTSTLLYTWCHFLHTAVCSSEARPPTLGCLEQTLYPSHDRLILQTRWSMAIRLRLCICVYLHPPPRARYLPGSAKRFSLSRFAVSVPSVAWAGMPSVPNTAHRTVIAPPVDIAPYEKPPPLKKKQNLHVR